MSSQTQSSVSEKRVLSDLHDEMEMIHPSYNRDEMANVARVYMAAIDKEGFVFDFDDAWEWAGYTRKADAKRILLGARGNLGLRENIDYKINFPPIGVKLTPGPQAVGRKSEKIMLTSRCFAQFALASGTSRGQMLRDVVIALTRLVKSLMTAIQSGTHQIIRVDQPQERRAKRLKVCESQKALMREVVNTNPDFGRFCGMINGETNKAVTGRYKYETARLVGEKSKDVNARDYMTPAQLAVAEAAEILSRDEIRATGGKVNPLDVHKSICSKLISNIEDKIHGKIADVPLNLRVARNEERITALEDQVAAIADEQDQQKVRVNTLDKYFK